MLRNEVFEADIASIQVIIEIRQLLLHKPSEDVKIWVEVFIIWVRIKPCKEGNKYKKVIGVTFHSYERFRTDIVLLAIQVHFKESVEDRNQMRWVSKRIGKCLHLWHFVTEVNELYDFVLDEGDIPWVVYLQIFDKVFVLVLVQDDLVLL